MGMNLGLKERESRIREGRKDDIMMITRDAADDDKRAGSDDEAGEGDDDGDCV